MYERKIVIEYIFFLRFFRTINLIVTTISAITRQRNCIETIHVYMAKFKFKHRKGKKKIGIYTGDSFGTLL